MRHAFLRGIFAAEGNIGIEYNEGKHYINQISFTISINENKLRKMIILALRLENIKPIRLYKSKKNSQAVIVSNWKNYILFWSINMFGICKRKKKQFCSIARNLDIYLELKENFRRKLFKSIDLQQKDIATIIDSWQGNISKTIKGKHLLRVEQSKKILQYTKYRKSDLIQNTKAIRIGSLTKIKNSSKIRKFLKEFKSI